MSLPSDFHRIAAEACRTYQADLKQFQPFLEEADGSLDQAYLAYGRWLEGEWTAGRYSSATFNRKVSAVRHLVRRAPGTADPKALARVPLKRIEPASDREDQALSLADAKRLVAGARDPKIRLMIAFLVGTGAGISEMLSLRRGDLTPTDRGFTEARVTGKTGRVRSLHVHQALVEDILGHFQGSELVFEHGGRAYNRISVTNRIRLEALRVLGREVTARHLRQTWVLAQVRQGREPRAALEPEDAFIDVQRR